MPSALLTSFTRQDYSLLLDIDVDEKDRIWTRNGAYVANDAFLDAFQKREFASNRRNNSRTYRNANKETDVFTKLVADTRRLIELADKRADTGKKLCESHILGREIR